MPPRSDRAQGQQIRWWQRGIQSLCRARPLNWLLLRPWAQAAFRSAKQHGPNRVPFGLKMTRFLFGYWPAGEPDPWHTADFLPALFGYTELTRSRLVACPRAEWTSNRHLDRPHAF